MKDLAIVVPVYNQEKWIALTLESIFRNRPESSCVYVHDDGSCDQSPEIAHKICEKYGFHFSKSENHGLTVTLNQILQKAKAHKYFFVIGGDDILRPKGLQAALDRFENNPLVGGVYGRVELIDGEGRIIKEMSNSRSEGMLFEKATLNLIDIPLAFVVWRVSALLEVKGYDERFSIEDLPLFRKISKRYPIAFVNSVILGYRKIGQGASSNTLKMVKQAEQVNLLLENESIYPQLQKISALSSFLALSKRHKKDSLKYIPQAILSGRIISFFRGLISLIFYHDFTNKRN